MLMTEGQIYRCQNPLCRCEILVTKASALGALQNPRCGCGGNMKKPYTPPVLRVISADVRVPAGAGSDNR
jgi:hypothetical protein